LPICFLFYLVVVKNHDYTCNHFDLRDYHFACDVALGCSNRI
jgi:hypothetical protein